MRHKYTAEHSLKPVSFGHRKSA